MRLNAQQSANTLIVNADSGKATISKYIYGHFSEHLGRCIYGGIWVGKKFTNTEYANGFRMMFLQLLSHPRSSPPMARRMFLPIHIIGWMVLALPKKGRSLSIRRGVALWKIIVLAQMNF